MTLRVGTVALNEQRHAEHCYRGRCRPRGSPPRSLQRGQSTVELALVLPVVMVIALGMTQIGLALAAQLSVSHVAREVGRVIAVDPTVDIGAVADAAHTFGDRPTVTIEQRSSNDGFALIEIYVEAEVPSLLPGASRTVSERLVIHRLE